MRLLWFVSLAVIVALGLTTPGAVAQNGRRAQNTMYAGPEDVAAHSANLWYSSAINVYLGDVGDPALAGFDPPDGPVLLVEGCTVPDAVYNAIQRMDPQGVIGVGRLCDAALQEASMFPEEREALTRTHPEYVASRRPMWDRVAQCESSGNWQETVGRYEGGLQFENSTWLGYGGGEFAQHAYNASAELQIVVGERVLWRGHGANGPQGRSAWPNCNQGLTAP